VIDELASAGLPDSAGSGSDREVTIFSNSVGGFALGVFSHSLALPCCAIHHEDAARKRQIYLLPGSGGSQCLVSRLLLPGPRNVRLAPGVGGEPPTHRKATPSLAHVRGRGGTRDRGRLHWDRRPRRVAGLTAALGSASWRCLDRRI